MMESTYPSPSVAESLSGIIWIFDYCPVMVFHGLPPQKNAASLSTTPLGRRGRAERNSLSFSSSIIARSALETRSAHRNFRDN